ncbi:MAG: asparagine synthase C-terminal domain-containing protein [Sandaracinaceae bacterium]|nr:asparagine synthase C-terminal domain-containing protein [Sandaracinaceae bacterium]
MRLRLAADVPVGAFLSGGIDSSTIVALAQRASSSPIRTFSIGFEDPRYDESGYAARVAKHLGTQHTELRVGAREEPWPSFPSLAASSASRSPTRRRSQRTW